MRKKTGKMLAISMLSLTILGILAPGVKAEPTAGQASLIGTVDVSSLPPATNSTGTIEAPFGAFPETVTNSSSSPTAETSIAGSSSVAAYTAFEGLNQAQGGANPPDVTSAAGPSHVVEMVNLAGGIWTKQGSLVRVFGLSAFFATGSDFISDPKVLFDAPSGRWFASILHVDNIYSITRGAIAIAVSTTNDPTGTWRIYNVADAARLPDQPIIGVSDDKFVVSVNDFGSIFGPFLGAHYWIMNKSQMVAGAVTVDIASFGPNSALASVHPVQSLSTTTTQYMVSTYVGGNTIWFFSITGVPPGIVTVNTVTFTVTPIPSPPNAVQRGTTTLLRTDDARVQSAAWYQNKLWFTLSDGCVPTSDSVQRSCVRLVQINTSSSSIAQNFDYGAASQYFFYPAVRIDSTGGLAVIYGFSSVNDYPSLAITGQAVNDPARSLAAPVTIRVGSAPNTSGRYGDYFGASTDPSDPTLVWVAGEYQPSASWATYIASMRVLSFTVSASPTSISMVADSTGTSTVTLTSLGGFSGTVSLSASASPAGLTGSMSPASVALTAGGTATSTLTTFSSTPGSYIVTVTGTSGAISHSTNVTVSVNSFSISVAPTTITIAAGHSGSLTVQASSINGYSASIALSIWFGLPTCVSSGFTKPTLTLAPGSTDSSVLLLTAASTCTSSTSGVYVRGTDAAGNSRYESFLLYISDFSLSVTPQPVGILRNACGDAVVTVYSLNGHSGLITLLGSGFPPEITPTFLTNPVSLPSGGQTASTLHLCAADSGTVATYLTTVSGSDGTISRSTSFKVLLNDYEMTVSPNPTVITIGSSASNTITISKYFGASATLTLSVTGLPSCVSYTLNPTSVGLPNGGQSILSMTASSTCTVGDFSVTVIADAPGTAYDKQTTFVLHIRAGGGGGGGGGSVMAGTQLTLIDGSKVPVQNLKPGDRLLSYDPSTNLMTETTVASVRNVTVDNIVKITLLDGTIIRTDNNILQRFWVMKPDGTIGLVGVPNIQIGDYLFYAATRTWVQIVNKQFITGGHFTMYDITSIGPYEYVVNGYLDAVKKIV